MGKSAPKAPEPPDPVATAQAQGQINREAAIAQAQLNRINQYTPYGNLIYSTTPSKVAGDLPQYSVTQTLSPEQQAIYEAQTKADQQMASIGNEQLSRLRSSLSAPISYAGAPALAAGMDERTRAAAEEALLARLNPQLDRDRAALDQSLATKGISLNSEAYMRAMDEAARQRNDARQQAVLGAMQLAQQQASAQNAARQQYIQEQASIRNQPLNEITALLSGAQIQSPQFVNVPQGTISPADYQSAAALKYQGQLAQWQQQQQNNNAMMGGLFGLGGTLGAAKILASDRRLKRDIVRVGEDKGFPLYRFRYLWDNVIRLGFMAQDVEKTRPDAVLDVGGFKAVNYGAL